MSRIATFTDKAPAPLPVFNQAIVANGFVYTSGSIAQDPATGKIIDGDIQAHTHRVIQNLSAVLDASGSSINDVVEVNIYLADMGDFAKMNEVYQTYWGDVKPARTCVAVKTLPANTDIEIKCMGVVSKPWNIQAKI
ncbi:Endoribonuclease L-PSP/chorismate mutase-like protein [Dactylonectria macrodidyma]|uniref:Endoribonuclease L-PSP/chorismate mutase-like protein n=1 Tax=Dactylonectria macrodidyma TaxID=307937 RepID=A0A9P9ES45_9HYPO|nr:Endoribonuclease L-PSP/chorismate mutase-like protein [Dactylonectria macrodidyma]